MRDLRVFALALALAACSNTAPEILDGGEPPTDSAIGEPPTDSAIDEIIDSNNTIDAPPGSVRVEASTNAGPFAGVTVVFLDAADVTVAVMKTGADGSVTGIVPNGGSVMAAARNAYDDRVLLWRSVESGDVLRATFDVSTTTHTVTYKLPALPPNLNSFQVWTRCGFSTIRTTPMVLSVVLGNCAATTVIATAIDYYNHDELRAFVVPGQSLVGSQLDLTAQTWSEPPPFTVRAENLPEAPLRLFARTRIDGVLVTGNEIEASAADESIEVTSRAIVAPGAESIAHLVAEATAYQRHWLYRGVAPLPALDASDDVSLYIAPLYDIPTRTLSLAVGPGDPPDTVRATIGFPRLGDRRLIWDVIQPSSANVVTLPTVLPPELDKYDPGTIDAESRRLRTYIVPGAYDRARHAMFDSTDLDQLLAQPGLVRMADSKGAWW